MIINRIGIQIESRLQIFHKPHNEITENKDLKQILEGIAIWAKIKKENLTDWLSSIKAESDIVIFEMNSKATKLLFSQDDLPILFWKIGLLNYSTSKHKLSTDDEAYQLYTAFQNAA